MTTKDVDPVPVCWFVSPQADLFTMSPFPVIVTPTKISSWQNISFKHVYMFKIWVKLEPWWNKQSNLVKLKKTGFFNWKKRKNPII